MQPIKEDKISMFRNLRENAPITQLRSYYLDRTQLRHTTVTMHQLTEMPIEQSETQAAKNTNKL